MTITMLAPRRGIAVHASTLTRAGRLAVRDATPEDVDAYVNYWHHSGEEIKQLLGIDPERLGTPEDSKKRFFEMLRVPDKYQEDVIFTVTLNDEVIGYSNINRCTEDSYVHLHTYRGSVRTALQERKIASTTGAQIGVAASLIGLVGGYFGLFPIRRVVLQTRTTNRWINRALDLYMPPAETKYVFNPPGLAAPGECHIRYVRREDIPWVRSRAEALAAFDRQVGGMRQPAESIAHASDYTN